MSTVKAIIKSGKTLQYTEIYQQTMMGCKRRQIDLPCPQQLKTLVKRHPTATVIIYGDQTLGIEVDGKIYRVEEPHHEMRNYKTWPDHVWQYLNVAIPGRSEYADRSC